MGNSKQVLIIKRDMLRIIKQIWKTVKPLFSD